jgi:2-polyprenyl-3-methyl-5-hydroxy-6-metoxy-1,4-benzoquinol methylase
MSLIKSGTLNSDFRYPSTPAVPRLVVTNGAVVNGAEAPKLVQPGENESGTAEAGIGARDAKQTLHCRFCGELVTQSFVDLGKTPLCESFLSAEDLNHMEPFYSLHAFVCLKCLLVQIPAAVSANDLFRNYHYFSSYSDDWLEHARQYTDAMIQRFGLDGTTTIVEIASNDGYLLRWFRQRGIRILGVEPAINIAKVADANGIPTLQAFFDEETAKHLVDVGMQPDLLIGNNVLAQVPDLNGFVKAMKWLLKPEGVITMEFPYLRRLVEECQFDTIYHEHFSYLTFTTVERLFKAHDLTIFDVEELWTHGGSLRIFAKHTEDTSKPNADRVAYLLNSEREARMDLPEYYSSFGEIVKDVKLSLLQCLIELKRAGKQIAAYGAPGKSATLLNYCGIRTDFIDYTVDRSPHKQGKFTPGTHIPIYSPERVRETRPDYLLILPWNLRREIMDQMSYIRDWGGKFIVPIPRATVY